RDGSPRVRGGMSHVEPEQLPRVNVRRDHERIERRALLAGRQRIEPGRIDLPGQAAVLAATELHDAFQIPVARLLCEDAEYTLAVLLVDLAEPGDRRRHATGRDRTPCPDLRAHRLDHGADQPVLAAVASDDALNAHFRSAGDLVERHLIVPMVAAE